MQLVMPPFMQVEPAIGMAPYIDSRNFAWPGRRHLGNGEGEFPLVGALFCLTEAQRPGGVKV